MTDLNNQQPELNKRPKLNKFKNMWLTKKGRWTLVIGALILLVLSGYIFRVILDVTGFGGNIYEKVDRDSLRDADISLKNGDPISILLVGIDNGALFYEDVEDGRTDVMIVLTINPKEKTSTIMSIPRDTLGPLGDTNEFDKLNHAYMNNGMEATIASIQRYLDIPIDHYVEVNMQGFIDVIDGLGGVKLTPTMTFEQDGANFVEGQTRTFTGVEAIHYARMRKLDPEGDIGRQKRQQQVVEAVIDEVLSLGTITNYDEILDGLENNVKTDFSVGDAFSLQTNYLSSLRNLETYVIEEFSDLDLYFGYYLYVPERQRLIMSNHLRENLGLQASNSAIVYPVSYGVTGEYFPVEDLNGDGYLADDEMAILPGVYDRPALDDLLAESFGTGYNYYEDYTEAVSAETAVNETDIYYAETESSYYYEETIAPEYYYSEPVVEEYAPIYEEAYGPATP